MPGRVLAKTWEVGHSTLAKSNSHKVYTVARCMTAIGEAHMATPDEVYEFKIDAFTPDNLPMAKLAEYMAELARLIGYKDGVHFRKIKKGSAVLQAEVDYTERPKVAVRLASVQSNSASPDAMDAWKNLNRMLQLDNATGVLKHSDKGVIINFPGRKTPISETVTIHEQGELDGQVIRIGGKDNTIPVWLKSNDDLIYRCTANESLAKELISYYLGPLVRVSGTGKWRRTPSEGWVLEQFTVKDWHPLDKSELTEAIVELRNIKGSLWNELDDPIGEWKKLRGE